MNNLYVEHGVVRPAVTLRGRADALVAACVLRYRAIETAAVRLEWQPKLRLRKSYCILANVSRRSALAAVTCATATPAISP